MKTYRKGNVQELLQIGTLAGQTLIIDVFDDTVTEKTLITSAVISWSIQGWTPIADCGPLMVGLAHSDYSAAEVEAVIENTGSWDEADLVQQEIASRKVRIVGILRPEAAGSSLEGNRLNNGDPIKTKLNWILNSGQTLDVWAYNMGQVAFATTSPQLHLAGHVNLFAA